MTAGPPPDERSGWLRQSKLGIACFVLFIVFLSAQSVTGWRTYDADQQEHHQPTVSYASYLGTGAFFEATFENWESEFLQMGALVLLSAILFQRGSPESRDPDGRDEVERGPDRSRPGAPWPVRVGGVVSRLYEHSLSIALFTLFAVAFVLHALGGTAEHNLEGQLHGEPPVTTFDYVLSQQFWFQSFQNWQSEFLSAGALVVLTIYLRQRGSPESKPVDEAHATTG
jgi:hypothetical protein